MLTPPSIGSIQRDTCIADMPLAPITSVNAGKRWPHQRCDDDAPRPPHHVYSTGERASESLSGMRTWATSVPNIDGP